MSTHATNAIVQTAKLVTLGDAIRAKAGLSAEMTLDEMATAVANIQTGGTYQSKTVSPSTSQQTVSPDVGYDALSSVTVNAMPSGSATTPNTTITANPTISVSASGLITASVSGSQSVTPSVSAGYVASGTAGTVTVNGSATSQLTVYNGEHHSVVQLISFIIEQSSYQAEENSTWGSWVASAYNTDGYVIVQDMITTSDESQTVYNQVSGPVTTSTVITNNGTYILI